jgi:nitrite reductase/ring-hydroxylating ferredoxin subunit
MIYRTKKRREFLHALTNTLACVGGGFILWGLKNYFSFNPTAKNGFIGTYPQFKKDSIRHFQSERFFVIRDDNGLYAMSDTCTHRNCMLREEGMRILCPCHDSAFDCQGMPLQGPVDKPLDHYFVSKDKENRLTVDINRIVPPQFRYLE